MSKSKSKNRLEQLLQQLPDYSDMSHSDLKSMIAEFIIDQPEDEVEKKRGTRSRLKLEALRLLHDIIKSEEGGDINSAILGVIAGNSIKGEE